MKQIYCCALCLFYYVPTSKLSYVTFSSTVVNFGILKDQKACQSLLSRIFSPRDLTPVISITNSVMRVVIRSAYCVPNLTSFRSLSNTTKSIEKISTLLFPMVWYKISFYHWWSKHSTATTHLSRMCWEKFLYGTFWISQWIDCNEMWVEVIGFHCGWKIGEVIWKITDFVC